jgi:hypothetical protein
MVRSCHLIVALWLIEMGRHATWASSPTSFAGEILEKTLPDPLRRELLAAGKYLAASRRRCSWRDLNIFRQTGTHAFPLPSISDAI